jgi:hypothetical protein
VKDNGPGLPDVALKGAMDFTVRVSSREAYVSPCRGAQGNALKTLLPMPWVIDPEHGRLVATAHGRRHEIRCGSDPISQRAVITDDVTDAPKSKNGDGGEGDKASLIGTEVRLAWEPRTTVIGEVRWPFNELYVLGDCGSHAARFRSLVEGFALFNPHAAFRLDWFGERAEWPATEPAGQKWKPCQPTSAHWYESEHLSRLIGAYITHDRENGGDRLVSDFVAEFDGLSGSKKRTAVLDRAGLKRARLSDLIAGGLLDAGRVGGLLAAMRQTSRPVAPKRLGFVGEAHLKARLLAMGVQEESFRYSRRVAKDGLPWALESAFGWLGDRARDERRIYTGANWSSAIKNPFRAFGSTGEGLETALAKMRATRDEPIVFAMHLAHPRVEYTDRGKSALIIAS